MCYEITIELIVAYLFELVIPALRIILWSLVGSAVVNTWEVVFQFILLPV